MVDEVINKSTTAGVAPYAAPYVDDLLARGQALSGSDPYHTYTGTRVAPLSTQQQQTNASVSGLSAGNLLSQGQGLIAQGANYTPGGGTFDSAAAAKYMNPYTTGVTDIATREAQRTADTQQAANASAAAKAGAFGGSRHAIIDAENTRNLNQHLGDMTTQGLAAAYTNAQQQYNADQNRKQSDTQFASNAAIKGGTDLADQGAKTFGIQQLAGTQQQSQDQKLADVAYQNFLGEQQHPYQQLDFMKGLLGNYGTNGTTNSTQSQTDPNTGNWLTNTAGVASAANSIFGGSGAGGTGPSIWNQVTSLFAKGGAVQSGLRSGRVAQLYGSLA